MKYKSVQAASGNRDKFDAELDKLLTEGWDLHHGTLIAFDSDGKITSYFQALCKMVPGVDDYDR